MKLQKCTEVTQFVTNLDRKRLKVPPNFRAQISGRKIMTLVSRVVMGQHTDDTLDRLQIVSVCSLRDQSTTQNHWTSLDPAIDSQRDSNLVQEIQDYGSDRDLGGYSCYGRVDTETSSGGYWVD